MWKIGIMAGGALLALAATGASAQVPAAGAYYGGAPAATGPAWQGAPVSAAPVGAAPIVAAPRHMDRAGYHDYRRGARMNGIWRDPAYAVNDWAAWGLGQPGPGMHWLRYYDDAILVDAYGTVVDCRHGIDWDGPRMAATPAYAGGGGYPVPAYGAPGTTVTRVGPNTTVTTQVIGGGACCGAGYAAGAYAVGPGMITITPGSVVTTTTTTTEETVYKTVRAKRAVRRPVRHYRPRCVKAPTCPVQGS